MTDKTKGVRAAPETVSPDIPDIPDIIEAAVDNRTRKHSSRRGFIKGALVSAVAVTATVKLAGKTASLLPEADYQKAYLKDIEAGDRDMKAASVTLMSDREKKDLVRMFTEDYGKSRS